MTKIKKWQLWLIVGITLLIAVGLICLNLYYTQKTVIIVFLVIDFLIMTFALQAAIAATFKFKPKPKKYPSKSYSYDKEILFNNLEKAKFSETKTRYGSIYLKVCDKVAYKVIIITDIDAYLSPEEHNTKDKQANKALKDCTKFVGHEIFFSYNDKALQTMPDFSFQGNNIFYEAFYYDSEHKILIEPNAIKANTDFKSYVDKMQNEFLGLSDQNGNNKEEL